jgi:IS5 family transposase
MPSYESDSSIIAEPRILRGDTRTEGKIFSLFEPSTEIIRKCKASKPNEFGKMVKLQEAENRIVIDYEIYDQRPSDSNLLVPAIETHQEMLGRTPHLVAGSPADHPGGAFLFYDTHRSIRKHAFCAGK